MVAGSIIMVQLQNQFLENSPFVGDGAMVADELLEPAIQIITLGRRRISTHSRILVFIPFLYPQNSIYFPKISTEFLIFLFWV
ncbi:Hypothetical predicted protein [Olea europaea subsp. europaea]|uniref:Uncharacterized protein n=1 Tax=Olea europaea subsp. europaea TaxID=158383 RepID=A0A8S0V6Q5_OLEEU|nr:Hypothetical predicted protein [Olea europaea subsp. europaea]